jgi:hypothetical protein
VLQEVCEDRQHVSGGNLKIQKAPTVLVFFSNVRVICKPTPYISKIVTQNSLLPELSGFLYIGIASYWYSVASAVCGGIFREFCHSVWGESSPRWSEQQKKSHWTNIVF